MIVSWSDLFPARGARFSRAPASRATAFAF